MCSNSCFYVLIPSFYRCNHFKHSYWTVLSDCSGRVNSPGCIFSLSLTIVSSYVVCNFWTRAHLIGSSLFCFMCYLYFLETGSVSVTKGLRVAIKWRRKENQSLRTAAHRWGSLVDMSGWGCRDAQSHHEDTGTEGRGKESNGVF